MRRGWIAIVCLLLWGGLGSVAIAQDAKPDYEAARQHYTKAQEALNQGDFSIAAREFGKAYEITKDPILFYKIAQANEAAGDCDAALIYYGRYLREANPSAQDRADAEQRVKSCEARVGSGGTDSTDTQTPPPRDTTATPPPPPVDPTPDPTPPPTPAPTPGGPTFIDEERSFSKTAAWVSVGVAVAAATTGAVLGLSASSREEDVDNLIDFRDPTTSQPRPFEGNVRTEYEEAVDEGENLEKLSIVAWGVAGAATAAAAVFFVLDATGGDDATVAGTRLTPVVGEDTVGVVAGWEF